jgi:DUF1365 family protein
MRVGGTLERGAVARTESSAIASAIYEGTIRHRRFAVRAHEFRHRVALLYVDLDELPRLLDGMLLKRSPGVVRFRRGDYLGEERIPLADAVRERVRGELGFAPGGPVRLLTQPRTFGHCFNPVSFYYCFDVDESLQAVLAEVTSTPWGERAVYAMGRTADGPVLTGAFAKRMHVSPFMGMDQRYTMRAATPGETLSVHIESDEHDERAFDATLALHRVALTRASLARATVRFSAASVRVLALIYGQALALKLKRVPVIPHPRTRA